MLRRAFITLCGGALLVPAKMLRAEHHVNSVYPLLVSFDLDSLAGRYTKVGDFYVRNHTVTPQDVGDPSLRVEGEVAKPQRLNSADLASLKNLQLGAVLECAGNRVGTNGMVSNGLWSGWPLGKVLDLAQPTDSAVFVHLFGREGWGRSVPIGEAYRDAMLATHLNGRPLDDNHGAPWRAIFPGRYGVDSVKWLDRMVVSTTPLRTDSKDYLQLRTSPSCEPDWQPLRGVQVKSVIVYPIDGQVLKRGNVQVRGLAWSGEGGVSRVELSIDGGTHWRNGTLDGGDQYEWAWWKAPHELDEPGVVELMCRATDVKGHTQPEHRDSGRLDEYENNWYHRVRVVVV